MTTPLNPTPTACAMCGSYSGTGLASTPALLAVCDVLVVRALEAVGRRIVRAGDRSTRGSRFRTMGTRPWHEAHTLWAPDQDMVEKGLQGCWDVLPALLDNHAVGGATTAQVRSAVDDYVRDLLGSSTAHDVNLLRYRLEARLGVAMASAAPYAPAREA